MVGQALTSRTVGNQEAFRMESVMKRTKKKRLPEVLKEALDSVDDENTQQNEDQTYSAFLFLPPPSEPMAVARIFAQQCLRDGLLTLRYWRGGWWMWRTTHWIEIENRSVRSILYRFTENALHGPRISLKKWS